MFTAFWFVAYALVVLGLSIYGAHRYVMVYLYYRHKKQHSIIPPAPSVWPMVTVQLPIYNEFHVVERLIRSVAALDYPMDKMEIQVLDDSTDETSEIAARVTAELAAQGYQIRHIRRPNRHGFKAGALAYGMEQAHGEFFAIFDADFLPSPEILRQTIPYFLAEKEVGLIQTRWGHLNSRSSLLTRLQGLFLDGHLLIEQTARCRSGRFLNFNGTAGIWRKETIISAGNWQHDTLTEDLDLSYRAQMKGWRFLFLPNLVTPAELPIDMNAFKTQQHRWAKGSIQTCKKLLPRILRSELPLKIKIEAIFHLTSNFAYLLLAFLIFLLQPMLSAPHHATNYFWLIDVPIFGLTSLSVILFYATAIREQKENKLKDLLYLPGLLALGVGMSINNGKAVLEAVFNHESEFTRTPKYGVVGKQQAKRKFKYISLKSILPWFEGALAFYFLYFISMACTKGQWSSVPFLILFLMGFAYVATLSIWPQAAMSNTKTDEAVESEPVIP